MLRTEDHDRVRVVTFDRPASLNAFNQQLYSLAAAALTDAAADETVSVVVLTGAGRAFSAGQDLYEMATLGRSRVDGPAPPNAFAAFVAALAEFPKPLLAAVNGVAVGIGFTMLAYCDLVLVSAEARMRTPFTELGVAPEAASSFLFPRRMGWQRAAWVLLSSSWVTAPEAVELGIAWRVCPPAELLASSLEAASALAALPLPSLMATKRLMVEEQLPGVRRARAAEDAAFAELLGEAANRAALDAFTKRPS